MGTPNEHLAPATRRAYASDWADFQTWLTTNSRSGWPILHNDVINYLLSLADRGLRASTIERRLSSVSVTYERSGGPPLNRDRRVRDCLAGIRRRPGQEQDRKTPLSSDDLRAYFATLTGHLRHLRDRAMLALGISGAFRRCELAALRVDDIEDAPEGLRIMIRSKTPPRIQPRTVGIPYGRDPATCPVLLLRAWLRAAKIADGPVFRAVGDAGQIADHGLCGRTVALVVKRCAQAIGKNAALYSGGSLRSGFCTEAAEAGEDERAIQNQVGLSIPALRRQIRRAGVFQDNAAFSLGL